MGITIDWMWTWTWTWMLEHTFAIYSLYQSSFVRSIKYVYKMILMFVSFFNYLQLAFVPLMAYFSRHKKHQAIIRIVYISADHVDFSPHTHIYIKSFLWLHMIYIWSFTNSLNTENTLTLWIMTRYLAENRAYLLSAYNFSVVVGKMH